MYYLRSLLLIIICLLSAAPAAVAGGLYLSEVATPGSLGTAGVANVVNNVGADSAYTNPAGMTGIMQDTVVGGIQVVFPTVRFDSDIAEAGGSDGGNAGFISAIPGIYLVKVLPNDFRAGLAIAAPLGGGVDYGDDFVGRYQANRAVLSGLAISPSVGYKINDRLSVGAGVSAIYTVFDQNISINRPLGLPDGEAKIDQIDDWSPQGFFGLTWQATDKAMIGLVYRTKSEVKLDGDFKVEGLTVLNRITSKLDEIEVDFDYAQLVSVGLKYAATDNLTLLMDLDWEDWSEFSEQRIEILGGATPIVQHADYHWQDTYHVGVGFAYQLDDQKRFITGGLAYDSSPVKDRNRVAELAIDEQIKIGIAYGKAPGTDKLTYSVGGDFIWLGDCKIDQTAQGVRYKGDFSTNYALFLGATLRYQF